MNNPIDVGTHLVRLRSRVDQHFAAARARSPHAMQCATGCDACCHRRFGVFTVEADPIREALARIDPAVRARIRDQARSDEDRCPLLVDGRCTVYEVRPIICRSHGVPVAAEDEDGETVVDHCRLNFVDVPPPAASILVLEAVNRPLAVLATLADATGARVELTVLALEN